MTDSRLHSGAQATSVLVVDDDRAIRESLTRLLELDGYAASSVPDGHAALAAMSEQPPDLLILDLMMPVIDGLTVCRVLRSESRRIPIIMLTARTETTDRVAGLDAGADDYLAKPFDPGELLARVRALLRRSGVGPAESSDGLVVDDLRIDQEARRCWRADKEIAPSKIEFDLLELLMLNADIVVSRDQIYQAIWGYNFGPDSKNLAVYISYLRRKVDEEHEKKLICTVRGVGYSLRRP